LLLLWGDDRQRARADWLWKLDRSAGDIFAIRAAVRVLAQLAAKNEVKRAKSAPKVLGSTIS
jgi:hypothetical protein